MTEAVSVQSKAPPRWAPALALGLLVVSTVSWRRGVYYEGGLDPVVLAKAAISGIALAVAWYAARRAALRTVVPGAPVWLLVTYVTVSCVGGWLAGDLRASLVLVVRVLVLVLVLVLLVHTYDSLVLVGAMVGSMVLVTLVAVATGAGSLTSGRLSGGLPPLSPNAIALLLSLPVLYSLWHLVRSRGRLSHLVLAGSATGLIWLTGSRAGLAALLAAAALLLLQVRRPSRPVVSAAVLAVPLVAYLVVGTGLVSEFLQRGGSASVTTLSSRTIAWEAALQSPPSEQARWVGSGLAHKKVPVAGQYWDEQILDSTWVSALVQSGVIGFVLVAALVALTVVRALRSPYPNRLLWTAALAFLIGRSFLESGMLDASPAFLAFFLVSLIVHRRDATAPGRAPGPLTSVEGTPGRSDARVGVSRASEFGPYR